MTTAEHVDVLIIGAGLSGIGAAAHLAKDLPATSYAVLERREVSGGTWDLFRYPGMRSDSDMHTLGYRFRPWRGDTALADGASILDYLRDTAREYGVDRHVRYGHRVVAADWDSSTARWTVTSEVGGERRTMTADFLWACSGYYDYDAGYTPHFEGQERFGGQVIHPQHWPDDLDPTGKRIVVIGSGATAVTLVPALAAGGAAHVTMLQRSPTYVLSVPARDAVKGRLTRLVGRGAVVRRDAVEEHRVCSPRSTARAGGARTSCAASSAGRTSPSSRPATPSTPTSTRPTTRGTSGCAWCRTATCSGPSGTAGPTWSPAASPPSPRPASSWSRGSGSRPTSSSPRPASTCRCSAAPS